jgi:signal transduction histidine kinase
MFIILRSRLAGPPNNPRVVGYTLRWRARGCKSFQPKSLAFVFITCSLLFQLRGVAGGTSEEHADNPKGDSYFMGRWEMLELNRTLDVALRLQPGSQHVVVVDGDSSFDRHLEALFGEHLRDYEARFDLRYFRYFTDLDMPRLLERLKPSFESKLVGRIALRNFIGQKARDIPIARGADACIVDWVSLARWGLKQSDLPPPGSNVRIRGPSFWVRTKWLWMSAFLITLCLYVFALYVRLRRMRERHMGLSGQLITAQEKERRRLASEIHDDFSQRIALLAIGLENAEEAFATSPDEAARQMHVLLNSASEIGADLHTLSHRLHSSTLERLGLVPGVSALCKEFAIRHGAEVDFLSDNIPNSIPPDVALCIFRIVQEGLRNFQKHSGAAKVEVRLRGATDKLFVSIRDKGFGFDIREVAKKEGLGIRSMEERAYLLGGRFKIHSEPGQGTEIIAWVPVEPRLDQEAG